MRFAVVGSFGGKAKVPAIDGVSSLKGRRLGHPGNRVGGDDRWQDIPLAVTVEASHRVIAFVEDQGNVAAPGMINNQVAAECDGIEIGRASCRERVKI